MSLAQKVWKKRTKTTKNIAWDVWSDWPTPMIKYKNKIQKRSHYSWLWFVNTWRWVPPNALNTPFLYNIHTLLFVCTHIYFISSKPFVASAKAERHSNIYCWTCTDFCWGASKHHFILFLYSNQSRKKLHSFILFIFCIRSFINNSIETWRHVPSAGPFIISTNYQKRWEKWNEDDYCLTFIQ